MVRRRIGYLRRRARSAEHCGHLGVDRVSLTLCPGRPDNSSLWVPLKRGASVRLTLLQDFGQQTTAQGREGAFGLFAAMYSRVSFNRCLVQLEGGIVRCPIELLQSEFKHSEYVRDLFVSYSETLLSQVQQSVACNAMHSTEERMCRWLLMMHDRAEGEALPYTHEFLSHMLGANRKSVTLAARSLQTAGLISYRRGRIQVLDRAGLEKASCECYGVVKERFDAFLTPPSAAVQGDPKARRRM
jgi:hypothetical protein